MRACMFHMRHLPGERVDCSQRGNVHLSDCGGCQQFVRRSGGSGIGRELHNIVASKTGKKPCGKCLAEIRRLESMTAQQVRREKHMIAHNMMLNATGLTGIAARLIPTVSHHVAEQWIEQAVETVQPTVQARNLRNARKHLLYHVWPADWDNVKWHIRQLLPRWDLFDGDRVLSVACNSPEDKDRVVDLFAARGMQFSLVLGHANDAQRGEAVTFRDKIKHLETLSQPSDCVFYAHAKGMKPGSNTPAVRRWSEMMYRACLDDWDSVATALRDTLFAGAFFRRGDSLGNGWHYSGAYYWFRLADVLSRGWEDAVTDNYYCAELFPGMLVHHEQSSCLFGCDNHVNLYLRDQAEEMWSEMEGDA